MKLRTKIQLFSSLFILFLVLLVNMAVYVFFYKISTNAELEELELITTDVISAINENPDVDPRGLMEAYLPANGMIRIISENNVPIIEQTRSKDYLSLPWHFSNNENRELITKEDAPDIVVIEKPLIWPAGENRGKVVTLQVSNHLVSFHQTMRTLLFVLGVLSLIVLVPAFIAGSLLSSFLLRPIQKLIQAMKENTKLEKWQTLDIRHHSNDEIHEMEMTFNEMIEQLKASYEKQEMFVSDASHELKTPIQIIKSYAQLLERRKNIDPHIFNESIKAIDSEADRIQKLVEQMLALAKNKQPDLREIVNIGEAAKETASTFQSAYHRDIHVAIEDKNLHVHGNRDQLKQIIYILIDNAIKYSDESIYVSVFPQDGQVILKVEDRGQGMAAKDANRIFDRFYRVDKARSRDTGGTGLGLSIAKSIAKAHGAELTVESEPEKGSIFTLKLKR
ncbi:HAMP domain-containing sensor histidine kinase [Sediminibacillus massiliensis]|uniref:HAMP domain-containing sensor histidine kinase n=1 Tax=Sediminibacillus massiliensis TaxID=1926277 RepID=UPI0009889477|nr:HAMP domain-containing histidine kinase [Sediminibacillus massiliensis]